MTSVITSDSRYRFHGRGAVNTPQGTATRSFSSSNQFRTTLIVVAQVDSTLTKGARSCCALSSLQIDLQQPPQVSAEDRLFVRIAQEVGIYDQIYGIGPDERLIGSIDDLADAHLGHQVSQRL